MDPVLSSAVEIGSSQNWLVAANCILAVLLALCMCRYRRLYLASRTEQRRSIDLIENLSEGIYRSTPEGRQISANRALVKLNGYDTEQELLNGVGDIATEWYVEPSRRDEFRAILKRCGRVDDFVSEIYRHKTRERIWVTESARLVCHETTGKPLFYEGSVREITETVKRLKIEERFQKLTRQLPGGLFQFVRHRDGRHTMPYLSAGASRISGVPAEEQIARPSIFNELVVEQDRAGFRQALQISAAKLTPWDHEFRIRSRDGEEKWVRVNARPEAENGDITWHGYLSDISSRKRQEMEIRKLAYFDPLTRLPNRRMFITGWRRRRPIARRAARSERCSSSTSTISRR
jgi:PAS domain S-box-containing protein